MIMDMNALELSYGDLTENTTAEQKARLLETKVAENMDTIAHLRQERSLLSKDHKDLQRRYSELSEVSLYGDAHLRRRTYYSFRLSADFARNTLRIPRLTTTGDINSTSKSSKLRNSSKPSMTGQVS